MHDIFERQGEISNQMVDWAKHYDFYEIELREMYKTVSKPQNESHFEMLKSKGAKYLNKKNCFCEIGFSAGLTLRYAFPFFNRIYGLDISPKNVEYTAAELHQEGYENIELFTCDLMIHDSRFDNKFDVISFIHGLEHFTKKDYPIVLNNIKAYLKPGGVFTGALPYMNNFNFRMCPKCNHVFEYDGHVSSHDCASLRLVFEENGYEVLYLDNFNLKYALKYGSLIKKTYRYMYYYLLNKRANNQIEYIVRPLKK